LSELAAAQTITSRVDVHNAVKRAPTTSEEIRKMFSDFEGLGGTRFVSGPLVTDTAQAYTMVRVSESPVTRASVHVPALIWNCEASAWVCWRLSEVVDALLMDLSLTPSFSVEGPAGGSITDGSICEGRTSFVPTDSDEGQRLVKLSVGNGPVAEDTLIGEGAGCEGETIT